MQGCMQLGLTKKLLVESGKVSKGPCLTAIKHSQHTQFVSGVVASTVSSRLLLGVGLALTAGVNLAFGASSVLPAFVLLWGMNGMLQGVGAPSCASILTRWFASKERGTYWGMWNIVSGCVCVTCGCVRRAACMLTSCWSCRHMPPTPAQTSAITFTLP